MPCGTAETLVGLELREVLQMPRDHAPHPLQHRRDHLGLCGQQHGRLHPVQTRWRGPAGRSSLGHVDTRTGRRAR